MSGTPGLKVYNADGVYIAACKFPEDAAALAAFNGDGCTIRDGHRARDTVWHEGHEVLPASESYDFVASTIEGRITARRECQAIIFANRQKVSP